MPTPAQKTSGGATPTGELFACTAQRNEACRSKSHSSTASSRKPCPTLVLSREKEPKSPPPPGRHSLHRRAR
eukprot:146183-Pleurochrysis_carterae.AAC.1